MARVVGDIAVEVGADISPLQRSMARGGQSLDDFSARATRMGRNFARVGGIIAAGMTAAAAGGYQLARSAADTGAEIERLSRLAGTTPEKFQRMAEASRSAGIEQDKLADILKDVQDRVGDFLATGGGPMADFFENIAPKVGVTADQFRELSGPDALQLFVKSLEDANVSQNEMTFYLEAMASDLSTLYPLLQNNGAEMKRMGDEAAAAGRVMSDEAVQGAIELQRELEGLTTAIRTQFTEAILENKDEILELAEDIETIWIPALLSVGEAITTIITKLGEAVEVYQKWKALIADGEAPGFTGGLNIPGFDPNAQSPNDPLSGGGGGSLDPSGASQLYGIGNDTTEGSDGGDFLQFQADQNAALEEQQLEHFERLGEILSNYQGNRFAMLSEGLESELALQQDYADKSEQLERSKAAANISAIAGMFGDLSSLMATENKKLFEIGKAAAIAEATVSGYRAAVEAWEEGMAIGGPPLASAFTAASLARTGSLIAGIASQQLNGGGSSGGGAAAGGGGAAAGAGAGAANRAPQSAPQQQQVSLTLIGDNFSRAQVVQMAEALNSASDEGNLISIQRGRR